MKKNLPRLLSLTVVIFISTALSLSQEGSPGQKAEKDNRPIDAPFDASMLIDNQTVVVPGKNSLELMIQHRFGTLKSTSFDLAGLYAPSNIRIGLRYSITNFLQIGIGSTKTNKLQDLNWKWSIIQQTRSGSIPVSLSYYGNIAFNLREDESFGQEYKFVHRQSYFHQLIVSRKLTRRLSIQALGSYAHFNQVDTIAYPGLKHDNFAIGINGRYKVIPQLGIIFSFDMPLAKPEMIQPSAGLGVEIVTLSHSFQIFLASYNRIMPQDNMIFNTHDPLKGDLLIGFNISRRWRF